MAIVKTRMLWRTARLQTVCFVVVCLCLTPWLFALASAPGTDGNLAMAAVRSINFVGNRQYSGDILRGVITTKERRWYRSPSTSTYDPDNVTFDRERLRRFYLAEGYADFRVVSAVAELTPDRKGFIITFTLDEGERYRFGKIDVNIKIKDLPPEAILPLLTVHTGDWYDAEAVEKSISILTDALGNRGYAFVEIKPNVTRNREDHTVDITFDVQEGPQVYVERIDIVGNVRTLDRVVRREMQIAEGDGLSTTKMELSRQRLETVPMFKKVELNIGPGSRADKTVLTVEVQEQNTRSGNFGIDFLTVTGKGPTAHATLQDQNFRGLGESWILHTEASRNGTETEASFTEPYFMGLHIFGKLGFRLDTGSSYHPTDLTKYLLAGFQLTMWDGVLVFPMPLMLVLLLRGAYYSYLWSDDQSRIRHHFERTLELCKATILLQGTYIAITIAIYLLNVAANKFVNG